jgi:hypothetical protein
MLYLINSTDITSRCDGIWETIKIEEQSARLNIDQFQWKSVVDHHPTAVVMGGELWTTIPISREKVEPKPGDRFLCFKLKGRASDGVELDRYEIKRIGYEWILILYHVTVGRALDYKFEEGNRFTQMVWDRR